LRPNWPAATASIATLNAVHSGLAMTTIAMVGSAEQRAHYLPRMATCEILCAFARTEPNHRSDVVALEPGRGGTATSGCWTVRSAGSATATAPSPTS
jgi:alkylation response protein AidB-like acyl-CoA dehydrogenase